MKREEINYNGKVYVVGDQNYTYFYASSYSTSIESSVMPCVLLELVGGKSKHPNVSIETLGTPKKGGLVLLENIFDNYEDAEKASQENQRKRMEKYNERVKTLFSCLIVYDEAVRNNDIVLKNFVLEKAEEICNKKGLTF